jgi:hypothetical protein
MGNETVKYLGLEKAPWTSEQSAENIINLVSSCFESPIFIWK